MEEIKNLLEEFLKLKNEVGKEDEILKIEEKILKSFEPIIRSKSKKFRGLDYHSALNEGRFAVLMALRNFSLEKNVDFFQYVVSYIKGYLQNFRKLLYSKRIVSLEELREFPAPSPIKRKLSEVLDYLDFLKKEGRLSSEESLIIELKFGLNDQIPRTEEEISAVLKISKDKIKDTWKKVREKLKDEEFLKRIFEEIVAE